MQIGDELAWAAGLFEGEGCIVPKALALRLASIDYDSIERFKTAVGAQARIRAYLPTGNRQPQYDLRTHGKESYRILALIYPDLGERRKAKIADACTFYGVPPLEAPKHTDSVMWAAGLFEGEGCITHTGRPHSTLVPKLVVCLTDYDILMRFQAVVGGLGTVYSRSQPMRRQHKPQWEWRVTGLERVQFVIGLLWNGFGVRRRKRAAEILRRATGGRRCSDGARTVLPLDTTTKVV